MTIVREGVRDRVSVYGFGAAGEIRGFFASLRMTAFWVTICVWVHGGDLFPLFGGDGFGGGEGFEGGVVFLFCGKAGDVVGGAPVPAGGGVELFPVRGAGLVAEGGVGGT